MAHSASTYTCCHSPDLTLSALIFGGLFVATTAVCGTLDASGPSTPLIEEVQVLKNEWVLGPEVPDLVGLSCEQTRDDKGSFSTRALTSEHCLNSAATPESIH